MRGISDNGLRRLAKVVAQTKPSEAKYYYVITNPEGEFVGRIHGAGGTAVQLRQIQNEIDKVNEGRFEDREFYAPSPTRVKMYPYTGRDIAGPDSYITVCLLDATVRPATEEEAFQADNYDESDESYEGDDSYTDHDRERFGSD